MKKPSISFFCPAYLDEKNLPLLIPKVYKLLKSIASDFEIVIVEDGSPDNTFAVAKKYEKKYKPKVTVIHHPKNKGYGATLRDGFSKANKYDFVFYTDGDNQYDVNELKRMLPFLKNYDAVIGYRTKRALTPLRQVQTRIYNLLLRVLFSIPARDIDCSMKIVRRSALRTFSLTSNTSFIDPELLIKLKKNNFKIKEVPVSHYPRLFGEASGGSPKVVLEALIDIAKYFYRYRILRHDF
ncbi:MAG TPA: glycosyltransferase family 2 protein [Candidatus Saccharimonadales bacterium]|nr:glycosyltransferase family 2 protein [Candidatus Saccharimonadales bacterium]